MVESSSLRAQLSTISTSADPAAQYIECFIEEIPATSSRAAHSVIKIKCTLCQGTKTWSSWNRIRAHLTGDETMALANGTTRCTAVTDEVAHQFKTIVREAAELPRRRSAIRRSEAAVDPLRGCVVAAWVRGCSRCYAMFLRCFVRAVAAACSEISH